MQIEGVVALATGVVHAGRGAVLDLGAGGVGAIVAGKGERGGKLVLEMHR